ncbi:NrtA/SsuA/CpmA family ABC transporter substrate-binding protein [Kumtagia ephedrae]|jgi:sulfonate transport system substrate-binding protein|uniref:Sulfonate ABC transporter substrate-binding protein n=1 Tax=Kumtagia ephedrae TaxID=2116701 RepID=A0A2P7ST26_9HYPH|nr:NrtA/SsuA/CpmA family ABC transporter substrate-binding protein [Mesorhizobium ephedrae]PSJ65639.1 sulfonate ABC transporter substrate-binding protein [Mesorhizobium ephedrae]
MSASLLKPSRRSFLATSLAGLGALGLAGGAPARASGRKTDTLRLTWGYFGLTYIARERGELEKRLAGEGIEVEWVGPFPNHAPTMQAVTGGTADYAFGGSTTPALAAILAGSPLVFTQFFIYEPRTTAIIARKSSGIATVEDLVGKSVAVNRSGLGEFLVVAALEKHNIDRSQVNFVYLNPPDAAPALAAGKVDAWSMWSPGVDIARVEYDAQDVFLEERDLPFQIDFNTYLTRRDFVADNPDLVRAFNAAIVAEAEWASANNVEAEEIAYKGLNYPQAVRDHFITLKRKYTPYAVTDEAFLEKFQRAADWLSERTVLPEKIEVAKHVAAV